MSDAGRRRLYDRDLDESRPAAAAGGSGIKRNIAQDVLLPMIAFFHGTTLDVRVNDPGNPNGIETYELTVPPETAPGARFRLPRAASAGGGLVQLRAKPFPGFRFKVRGSDLRCDLRISAQRATHGGTEIMAGPAGNQVRIVIPPRVPRGEVLRVLGQGLPKLRGGRGDLLVRITYRPEVRVSGSR